MFCRASIQECETLNYILHSYENTSGQNINFDKSIITFNKNSNSQMSIQIQAVLGVQRVDQHARYLGLPIIIGKSKW